MSDWIDIGGGVQVAWLWGDNDEDSQPVALMERHDPAAAGCDPAQHADEIPGAINIDPAFRPGRPHWTVEAGTLGQVEGLTLSPSVLRRGCGLHGWIRDGRWISA